MTLTAHWILLILAFVLFLLQAFGARHPRVDFTALGLALAALAFLVSS
jgi:hypothetical protein